MEPNKIIDGKIRVLKPRKGPEKFYDFEVWGEGDSDLIYLDCFTRLSNQKILVLVDTEAASQKAQFHLDDSISLRKFVEKITGYDDLVPLEVLRFEDPQDDKTCSLKDYLKSCESSVPIYRSIFDGNEEAVQVGKLSVHEFSKIGGKIELIADAQLEKI